MSLIEVWHLHCVLVPFSSFCVAMLNLPSAAAVCQAVCHGKCKQDLPVPCVPVAPTPKRNKHVSGHGCGWPSVAMQVIHLCVVLMWTCRQDLCEALASHLPAGRIPRFLLSYVFATCASADHPLCQRSGEERAQWSGHLQSLGVSTVICNQCASGAI